jgi:hypothetical protein
MAALAATPICEVAGAGTGGHQQGAASSLPKLVQLGADQCASGARGTKISTPFGLTQILELLEHTPIFSAGYKCILHIHSVVEECECTEMRYELDPKTKSKKKVLHGTSTVSACGTMLVS